MNSVFAVCQTQSSQKPVTVSALILCALDWAHHHCKITIPNFLLGNWNSSKQNAEPAFMLLSLEKLIGHLETIAAVRQEILRVLQQPTVYYGKINISQWKEAWEIPIAFRGLEQTYLKSALAIRISAQILSCCWASSLTPTSLPEFPSESFSSIERTHRVWGFLVLFRTRVLWAHDSCKQSKPMQITCPLSNIKTLWIFRFLDIF